MNCKKSVFVSFVISLTLLVVLGACNTSMFLPAASTDPIASKNLASTAEMSADTPPPANSPTITPTPTEFVVHVPTPTYTFTHFPALADGSDLQTATPITYFRHLPYIQILQDNQVVEPVHGVINLSYGPFVFRYVARPGFSMYVNFSLTDTFQNMAHDGFDPFLPCPNPFCQGNEYPLDGHVIAIDDNQYAELRYCRISLHSLPSDISEKYWIWDWCSKWGGDRTDNSSEVREHDLRMFRFLASENPNPFGDPENTNPFPVSDLRLYGDRIYITVFCGNINRVSNYVAHANEDFDLIKLVLQFEDQ